MDWSFFASRWRLCSGRHRCVDCSHHGLGLVEVSHLISPLHWRLCVSVLRRSLLLRPPAYALQSSGTTSRRPNQQLHRQFWSHFGNPRSQFEGRNADYSMYSTFLTSSSGSVLFNRSNLLKRKDLCFSCLRLGLIRHRKSLRSSHLFSSGLTRFRRVTTRARPPAPRCAPYGVVSLCISIHRFSSVPDLSLIYWESLDYLYGPIFINFQYQIAYFNSF